MNPHKQDMKDYGIEGYIRGAPRIEALNPTNIQCQKPATSSRGKHLDMPGFPDP